MLPEARTWYRVSNPSRIQIIRSNYLRWQSDTIRLRLGKRVLKSPLRVSPHALKHLSHHHLP